MEKFIIAAGVALRVSDTGKGQKTAPAPGDSSTSQCDNTTPQCDNTTSPGDHTLVLLHGYLENLNIWDDLTPLLQPHARVVALDLPGHGISEVRGPIHTMDFLAEVVYEALTGIDVAKCTVIGHSMGGYVALALAGAHPEIIDGLVLFSSTPNADSPEKRHEREREIAIIESGKKELLSRTQPGRGFAPDNRRRLADRIEDLAELIMLTEDDGITALLRGMAARPDRGEMLRALPVPELFILGRHDEYITPEVATAMITAQPQAQVAWLESSGHNGIVEEPRAAAEAILKFIESNNHNTNKL